MATISRYYSNTFSDHDKQLSLNVFLGQVHPSDRYLATFNSPSNVLNFLHPKPRQLTDILGSNARKKLEGDQNLVVQVTKFEQNYSPLQKLTTFDDIFSFTLARQYAHTLSHLGEGFLAGNQIKINYQF